MIIVDIIIALILKKASTAMRESWSMDDTLCGYLGWGIFSITRLLFLGAVILIAIRIFALAAIIVHSFA